MHTDAAGKRLPWHENARLLALLLVVLSLLQYALTLKNGLVWDSELVVLRDPSIRDIRYLPSYFSDDFFKYTEPEGRAAVLKYYRPLVKMLFLGQYTIFGTRPPGYHAVNILLNSVVVLLAFILVLHIMRIPAVAFLACLLYAVNPTRVEAVNWVYSVSSIMMAMFSLTALILHARRRTVWAVVAYCGALLSRESAVLLPVVIVMYEFLVRGVRWRRAFLEAIPYLAADVMYLAVRTAAVGPPPVSDLAPVTILNTGAVVLARYVKIFFLPDAPVTIYRKILFTSMDGQVLAGYGILVLLIVSGVVLYRKKKDLFFWFLWFFVWIAISLNIGKHAEYLMGEKAIYLASLGFSVLLASLTTLPYRRLAAASRTVIVAMVILHSIITLHRIQFWRNTTTYIEKAIEFDDGFYLTHYMLGSRYASVNDYDRALSEYTRTVELNPRWSMGWNNIGNIHYIAGDMDTALSSWQKAISADPANPLPYYNIGMIHEKRGEMEEALSYYERALKAGRGRLPLHAVTHIKRIRAVYGRGQK